MFDYFNGSSNVKVHPVDKLLDLNQEEANLLSTGPQDLFFSKLEVLNQNLDYQKIKNVDVTDKWNWKPGTYDKVKELIYNKLYLHKKTNGLDNLMRRTTERVSYLNYIKRNIADLEYERNHLKTNGFSKDVDVDKFTKECTELINGIIDKCKKAYELTKSKVLIVPYVSQIENRQPKLYYDVTLSGLDLNVYQGEKLLQSIPLNDLHIVVSSSLRHKLSGMKDNDSITGSCLSKNDLKLSHPYLQTNDGPYYSRCCLDKHYDDIHKSLHKNDLVSFAFLIMQWAQYYNTDFSNPFNQPYMSHLGMPKSFSDAYAATQSKNNIITHMKRVYEGATSALSSTNKSKYITEAVEALDCRYTEENSYYLHHKAKLNILDSDQFYQIESLVHLIMSKLELILFENSNLDNAINEVADIISHITLRACNVYGFQEADPENPNYGNWKIDKFLDYAQNVLQQYYVDYYSRKANIDSKFDENIFTTIPIESWAWLLDNDFAIVEVKVDESKGNAVNEMEELMKQWAYSSERS